MAIKSSAKTFTVRFPDKLHASLTTAASRRQKSLNNLMQEITEAYLRQEEEKALFDSYTRLGEDMQECSVAYAWDAQREAVELADK